MSKPEKDPGRCRDLRQIDRTIRDTLSRAKTGKETANAKKAQLMSELKEKRQHLAGLQKAKIIADGASNFRGPVGVAGGMTSTGIAAQIAFLESEIRQIETRLAVIENDVQHYRQSQVHFTQKLRENVAEIEDLQCVI